MQTTMTNVLQYLEAIAENDKFDTGTRLMFLGVHGMIARAMEAERQVMLKLIEASQELVDDFDRDEFQNTTEFAHTRNALDIAKAHIALGGELTKPKNAKVLEQMALNMLYELAQKAIATGATRDSD